MHEVTVVTLFIRPVQHQVSLNSDMDLGGTQVPPRAEELLAIGGC